MLIALLLASIYMGWNLGANDTANCVGTAVGSGIISYKRAVLLVAVAVVAGAVLEGGKVMNTMGKGIIIGHLADADILIALITGGLFVTFATLYSLPVSTTQAIVGSLVGVGVVNYGFSADKINFAKVGDIALSWVISPFLAAILAFFLYFIILKIQKRVRNIMLYNRVMYILVLVSVVYVSYSLGANNIGNVVGPIYNVFPHRLLLQVIGALGIALGVITFSKGVVTTIGKSITPLDVGGAFSAQMSGAIGMHFFAMIGIPVSASQAVVGAVIGVGLVRGMHSVSMKKILEIIIGWVATPTVSAILAIIAYKIFR